MGYRSITMPFEINIDLSFTLQAVFIVIFVLSTFTLSFVRAHGDQGTTKLFRRSISSGRGASAGRGREAAPPAPLSDVLKVVEVVEAPRVVEKCNPQVIEEQQQILQQMQLHKEFYFKLQNLEQYPEILPQSRDLLVSLFSETLADARKSCSNTPGSEILSIEHYTRESLEIFLQNVDDKTNHQWEQYLARRKAGRPREMFKDREEAKWWLKQVAPVKYVDGAWLGHINKITTPFALRRTVKDAWQVLSEELGDGDLAKNHAYIYHELMKVIAPGLPDGDTTDFIHPRHKLNEPGVWRAAIAQLLISLFPHEFLPEILGFNMQFEAVGLWTLVAAKELQELKLDAYYFLLHISIDNADSGHTAIAMQAVDGYIEHIQQTQGDSAAQQAWKRVQAGFILSECLPTSPVCPSMKKPAVDSFPRNEREADVIKIFKAKARVAHKIHCSSGMKIGRQTLVDWLEPDAFASKQWQMDFLDDLSNMNPWVWKGNSSKSKLIQQLSWEGKMFGSFTQTEVEIVQRWIDFLGNPDPRLYWSFIGQTEITSNQAFQNQNICIDYPVFSPTPPTIDFPAHSPIPPPPPSTTLPDLNLPPIKIPKTPNMAKLLPLWFAHPCLLESFISIPFKTTSKTASAILRLLRAQSGFGTEGPVVAGMDEVRRTESVGLVELGLEMIKRHFSSSSSSFNGGGSSSSGGLPILEPGSLKEVLENWHSDFALTMLHLSMRPMQNLGLLLGLAHAFVELHEAIASSTPSPSPPDSCYPTSSNSSTLLSPSSKEALKQISRRGRDSLNICFQELLKNNTGGDSNVQYVDYCRGYILGRSEIEKCLI